MKIPRKTTVDGRWMLAWVWAAAVLPAAMFGAAAWHSHTTSWQQARADIDHAARLANEHAQRVLQTHELVFDRIDDELSDVPNAQIGAASNEPIRRQLLRILQRVPALKTLSVWDIDGRLLVTTDETRPKMPEDRAADSELVRLATTDLGRTATHYTVLPDATESTGQLLLMSRRREDRMGRFAGVVTASIRPSFFYDFYTELSSTEPGMSLSLFDQKGRIVTRMPPPAMPVKQAPLSGEMMKNIAAGQTTGMLSIVSPMDQRRRLIAYRRIADTPLYTAAAKANDVILAEWRSTLWLLAALIAPMALALVYVAMVARRRTQREMRALRRLNKEADRRLKIEAALRQSQKLEAMGHLTGGVAHDVNNLLMVVNNNAHLLERLHPGADAAPAINSIKRAVEAGTRLTRQLLAFSRRQAWRAEVIDLRRWLPSVIELLRHTLTQSIGIEHEVAQDIRMVSVDAAELELALINLAINARDAMPQGGVLRIVVRNAGKAEVALDGEFVEIRVSDAGVGIAPELLERVFEPFFTTKEMGKGTGLGLSQVYGFCKQAGGTALIHSTPGKGTSVSMFLLAAPQTSAPAPSPGAALPEGDGRVLMVEDNDEVAAATSALLEGLGYRISRASSAAQALQSIAEVEAPFDAVLSDIAMAGGMDGIELALSLRQSQPDLPVVLMTGYTSRLDAAMAAGLTVIAKPCQPHELATALARAIQPH